MKLYKTKAGLVIESDNNFYLAANETWDSFINDDAVYQKTEKLIQSLPAKGNELITNVSVPIGSQLAAVIFMRKYMKPKGRKCFLNQLRIESLGTERR